MDNKVEIQRAFKELNINIASDDVLEEATSLCRIYHITAEMLASKWEALVIKLNQKENQVPQQEEETFNMNCIERLTKELQRQMEKKSTLEAIKKGGANHADYTVYNKNKVHKFEANLKNPYVTPETNRTGMSRINANDNLFSPNSFSPMDMQSATKYKDREKLGKIEAIYNPDIDKAYQVPINSNEMNIDAFKAKRCDISLFENFTKEPYRYMFEKIAQKGDALDEKIDSMAEEIMKQYNLPYLAHPGQPKQTEIVTVGRVCCDSEGKLNDKSVLLEVSRKIGNGFRVKLNLNDMPYFSLFPGQILGVAGINSTGIELIASKIYTGCIKEMQTTSSKRLIEYQYGDSHLAGQLMKVIVASGPYTIDDSLNYEPFNDLMMVLKRENPDVLILMGPFIDCEHPAIKNGEITCSFQELFANQIAKPLTVLLANHSIQIILIPSLRDVIHDFIFPQSLFPNHLELRIPPKILKLSNPITFVINEVVFGISTNDILFHLGAEEISRMPADASNDRLCQLTSHIIQQRSYYPLFPPAIGSQLERSRWKEFELPITPDVLILPSELKYFAKNVNKVLCINPGRLTKRQSAGTYAKLMIFPIRRNDIPLEDAAIPHQVAERSKVEIIRI